MDIVTPQQLWENYDRHPDPAPALLSDTPHEKRLYFSGFHEGEAVVRVYGRLVLPEGINNPPVIILAASANKDINTLDAGFFTRRGFAVLMVDYFGKTEDGGELNKQYFTIYPKAIDAFWQSEPAKIKIPPAIPQKSCWFYWTTCILHAVTFLEGCGIVDPSKIGVMGLNEGASLVFKSSVCPEIKGGITFFCGDLIGSEDHLAYKISLDSRAYANGSFPILINATTNEKNGTFDYLSGLYDASKNTCFCVYPSADRAVSDSQRDNVEKWFNMVFNGRTDIIEPEVTVFGSGGALYAEVRATDADVRIYYAEDCPAAYRNWKEVIPLKAGESKFLSKLDVFDSQKPISVFANIGYSDGFVFSTSVVTKIPAKLNALAAEQPFSRLIYQSEAGKEGWLAPDGEFNNTDSLRVAEGPFGLEGVAGDSLVTYKTGDFRFRGKAGSLLQIIVSASTAQDVEFSVIEPDGAGCTEYKCTKKIAAKEWTTVTLSAEDFKSVRGQCKLDKTVGIRISGKDIMVNSMLWV